MAKYRNYFTGKVVETHNQNVPPIEEGVTSINGNYIALCGERPIECEGCENYFITYYIAYYNPPSPRYGRWAFWKVANSVGARPQPTNMREMRRAGIVPDKF